MTTAEAIAARIKQLLESLRQPLFAPFLAEWPRVFRHRKVTSTGLPVLRWLPEVAGDGAAFAFDLVASVCAAAHALAWLQTYAAQDIDRVFLDNYGWSELFGGNGPLMGEGIACGFLMLGPATHYPRHRHEAEEIYLPLSGTASWQQGDNDWRERPPGTAIYHASNEPHAMRTGARPLLALYVWRGSVAHKARLDDAAG